MPAAGFSLTEAADTATTATRLTPAPRRPRLTPAPVAYKVRAMPDLTNLAIDGVRTLHAFGKRIPRAGGLLAESLPSAVHGKTVLITGASSGIGEATALSVGAAGGHVLLVARTRSKLEEVAEAIFDAGGSATVHPCDLTDLDDIDRMAEEVLRAQGHVDVLINNAGKSIRRSVDRSYHRFHDYERTMTLNYFAPVKLILALLPEMRETRSGHIINISSIGLQINTPRFAAYLASKAALDAFSRSIGPEIIGDGVHLTTVYMPLVRTPMIAPTKVYDRVPTLRPAQAADMITDAIRKRPKRTGTTLGSIGQLTYAIAPGAQDLVVNRAYQLFPEDDAPESEHSARLAAEQRAFAQATRGVHW
jgi:short-subunit dehydrogenase